MYILTHSNNLTRVSCGELLLESEDRPELPFAFDALYFEEPTSLAFKVLAAEHVPLTAEEIAACKAYCDAFLHTADYPVFAYDAAGVFAGSLRKSEAMENNLAFTFPYGPDHPASKWTGETWARIKASILDDGTLILDPASLCERCTLALTAEEWAAFPPVPDAGHGEVWKWDFAAEAWKDVSDPLVFAYDEADAYVGQFNRSVAAARGWGWRETPPDGWAYKHTPQGWQRVEAVIYENGHYERLPGGIRNDAMLLFTREEWAAWPQRPGSEHGEIWAWDFRNEAWEDVSDPYGCAFELEGEQAGLYLGDRLRSEARAAGLGFTHERPRHPVSKWNGTVWERVVAVFMDDGTVHLNPDSLCERCMLPLTAAEWAAFPQPERTIPAQLGGWQWNFAAERWEDRRETDALRALLTLRVMQRHRLTLEAVLDTPFELTELELAVAELRAWQADATAATPFVDARHADADKATLAAALFARHAELAAAQGRLAAERTRYLEQVAACADNAALDRLFVQIEAETRLETPSCSRA